VEEETNGAPEGYDHATAARVEQAVECGECGRTIPAGDWLWLLSRGEVEEAEEVKVLCLECGAAAGCTLDEPVGGNGA
jgi:ribosomal protein S27E